MMLSTEEDVQSEIGTSEGEMAVVVQRIGCKPVIRVSRQRSKPTENRRERERWYMYGARQQAQRYRGHIGWNTQACQDVLQTSLLLGLVS